MVTFSLDSQGVAMVGALLMIAVIVVLVRWMRHD
jgi:hypothetical protein